MKTIDKKVVLMERIVFLRRKQDQDLQSLKEQFQVTYESIKPLNLIKSTFHEVTSSPDIRKDLLNGAINLATGYVSNKLFHNSTNSPVKNLLGIALKFVMRKFVGNNSEASIKTEQKNLPSLQELHENNLNSN